MTHGTASESVSRPATVGQLKDIIGTLVQSVAATLSFGEAQAIIGRKTELLEKVRQIFASFTASVANLLALWQRLYLGEFGIEVDTANVRIPERPSYPAWLILIAQGITPNRVIAACRKHFTCSLHVEDFDAEIKGRNDREPTETYAIWVRATVAADEELKGLSADVLKGQKIAGITLLERLLLEIKYFLETGEHLDPKTVTLCSGSRFSDGRVPDVRWSSSYRLLRVYRSDPRDASSNRRARAAVA